MLQCAIQDMSLIGINPEFTSNLRIKTLQVIYPDFMLHRSSLGSTSVSSHQWASEQLWALEYIKKKCPD